MKRLAFLAIPALLFSYEINFSKKFSKEIEQDTLSTNVTIKVRKDSEKEISKELVKFNDIISDNKEVDKKSSNLSITPKYVYKNNSSYIDGYVGNLTYSLQADEMKKMNSLLDKIIESKDDKDISIVLSSLNWIVKDSSYEEAVDTLRLETLKWVNEYKETLSKELSSVCSIKGINFSATSNPTPMFRTTMMHAEADMRMAKNSMPTPESSKESIEINPTFKMECE